MKKYTIILHTAHLITFTLLIAIIIANETKSNSTKGTFDLPAGSFFGSNLKDTREITIYWTKSAEKQSMYNVKVINDNTTKVYQTTDNFIRINATVNNVTVLVSNDHGIERLLFIPSVAKKLQIRAFTNHKYNNGTNLLSWRYETDPNNFTIFWCKNVVKNQCSSIEYKVVNGNVRKIGLNFPMDYQLALAANTNDSSSGLKWTDCETMGATSVFDKDFKPESDNLNTLVCEAMQINNALQSSAKILASL